jgi:hypothetical protein
MAINETSRLIVEGRSEGQVHLHTLAFRQVSLPAGGPEQDLIDDWRANLLTAYRALWPTFATQAVLTTSATQICGSIPLRATVEMAEPGATQPGTRTTATEALAPWLCARARLLTAFAGRERRGQFFISALVEADVVVATIQTSFMTPFSAYCAALIARYGPSGTSTNWRLVVHSRKLASVPGVACQDASTLVTSALATNVLTSQRSRRSGSGT